jgi:hypothetical protein
MTYKELLSQLSQLSEDQLNQDVCVYNKWEDHFIQYDVDLTFAGQECDALGLDHPIIRF